MTETNPIILSLFPNARGVGYACIDVVEKKLLDYGVANVRPIENDQILHRIKTFVEYHNPTVIIVRDAKGTNTKKITRLEELHLLIEHFAKTKQTPIFRYTRRQIRDVFEMFGITSKQEIAKQLIVWFDELAPLAPRIRKQWMDEDYNMGVFDAVALFIAHQYLTEEMG